MADPILPTLGPIGAPNTNTTQIGGSQQPAPAPGGNLIQGNLNFEGGGAGLFSGLSGDPNTAMANLGPNYANAYQSALDMNKQNYGNILQGYQQTMAGQQQQQQGIQQGYTDLGNNIQGLLQGANQSQLDANQQQYNTGLAGMYQNAAQRGLGNTTVTDALKGGLGYDLSRENLASRNQFAQTQAGYMQNTGLAGLDYRNQANLQNTALAGNQLNWMNSITSSYPNAGQYGQLAQQFGAAKQSTANQKQFQDQLGAMQAAAGGGTQALRNIGGGYGGGGGAAPQRTMGPGLGGAPVQAPMPQLSGYDQALANWKAGGSQLAPPPPLYQGTGGPGGKPYAAAPGTSAGMPKGGIPGSGVSVPKPYSGTVPAGTSVGSGGYDQYMQDQWDQSLYDASYDPNAGASEWKGSGGYDQYMQDQWDQSLYDASYVDPNAGDYGYAGGGTDLSAGYDPYGYSYSDYSPFVDEWGY